MTKKKKENIYVEPRKRLIKWVKKQLIGPPEIDPDGVDLRGVNPINRFPCGALYPILHNDDETNCSTNEELDTARNNFSSTEGNTDENNVDHFVLSQYTMPSSLGFSFYIEGDDIRLQILCHAVQYECKERDSEGKFREQEWRRKELVSTKGDDEDFENIVCPKENKTVKFDKLQGLAHVEVLWRRFASGWLVTVSLANKQKLLSSSDPREAARVRAEKTLFEVNLRCVIDTGTVGNYPRVDRSLLDEEEHEIEVQYSNRHIYAIGHSCAANWQLKNRVVSAIYSETMPIAEVPQMTADTSSGHQPILSFAKLKTIVEEPEEVIAKLTTFINDYSGWIASQENDILKLPKSDQKVGIRIIERMKIAVLRMHMSLSLLGENLKVRLAFGLANQAMLDQMSQQDKIQNKYSNDTTYRWRPFQLAFLLTTLESTANNDSEYRDFVDLIWFPTGGGKTEAYFGLIAFEIALRRLLYSDTGGGTTVLIRYTLQLLTRDQFRRAIRLICALELIRQGRQDLGKLPITIGLWVGRKSTPNTFEDALKKIENEHFEGFVLDRCPWCNTAFNGAKNFSSSTTHFYFVCSNKDCDFGKKEGVLPCNVIDEALYKRPPTVLIGTIDKFARLTWAEETNVFFGGSKYKPPSLIIQDELHLIANALGSIAGLYEAAIDTVLRLRGVYPKYIASTATIRMAKEQIKQLYGRDFAVFPPSGLSYDDSYFARTIPLSERPGRFYVGYLAPILNRQECMAPLAAALLSAPQALFENEQDKDELLDAWWTQVVYHGSLKGVSNSHTLYERDVIDFIDLLKEISDPEDKQEKTPPTREIKVRQLTSQQKAEENAEIFGRLKKSRKETECLDAVLATNMISVGLDVARLALMIINGQPLTTAEYIQASSRVGRSDIPGIVFINFYRSQARSLSHYESFRPYHEAFYRFVEPTSVTPYTYQARSRALHAALTIVIRHSQINLLENAHAASFNENEYQNNIKKAIDALKIRCKKSCPEDFPKIAQHIDSLLNEWQNEAHRCCKNKRRLEYEIKGNDEGGDALLYGYGNKNRGLWLTLHSMRNVEQNAALRTPKGSIPIRLSHLVGHNGVGSIVRGPNCMVIVEDIRYWKNCGTRIPYVKRVCDTLEISQELHKPPVVSDLEENLDANALPATKFPAWMYCPDAECGRMYYKPWRSFYSSEETPRCEEEHQTELKQVSWVLTHSNGSIAEVPWHYIVHKDSINPAQENCKVKDQLTLIKKHSEGFSLSCLACKAAVKFSDDYRIRFDKQNSTQPWITANSEDDANVGTNEETAQILAVNDARIYSPKTKSMIVIPPESRLCRGTIVDLLYRNSIVLKEFREEKDPYSKEQKFRKYAKEYRCTQDEIKDALKEIEDGYPYIKETYTEKHHGESEYKAFFEDIPDQRDDEDFVIRNKSSEWAELMKSNDLNVQNIIDGVSQLVRVDRLKAVKVFTGFTRLDGNKPVPPDTIGKSAWLPAIELYGEGIFFALNETRLKAWEQSPGVVKRLHNILPRFEQLNNSQLKQLTARFMLLHTLSHLLMRQIEAEGGYPAAGLFERIYCADGPNSMAGILIHVMVPDVAGSLGGIAELGEPERFLKLLVRALEHSKWCSLDPVCCEHKGQGPGLLNRAACYACTLVPETACEYGNALLDRVFVKGDTNINFPSYFEMT